MFPWFSLNDLRCFSILSFFFIQRDFHWCTITEPNTLFSSYIHFLFGLNSIVWLWEGLRHLLPTYQAPTSIYSQLKFKYTMWNLFRIKWNIYYLSRTCVWHERANNKQQFKTINNHIYFWRFCRDYGEQDCIVLSCPSTHPNKRKTDSVNFIAHNF